VRRVQDMRFNSLKVEGNIAGSNKPHLLFPLRNLLQSLRKTSHDEQQY